MTPPAAPVTTVSLAAGPAAASRVKAYDFRRPDKFSKDQLRTLQAIHESVARGIAARLSARLRTSVTLTLGEATQVVFDEYVMGLTLPTHLVVLGATGLGGPILIDFDLGLARAAVDRLLGGSGPIPDVRSEPTRIEAELIERIFSDVPPAIAEGWAQLESIDPQVTETALGPALLRIAAPSHVVAVLPFEVRLPGVVAPLTMCYPYAALEPLLPRLSATAWYAQTDRAASSEVDRALLEGAIRHVTVPVAAVLGPVEIPVEALAHLREGDVIHFDDPAAGPIVLTIQDQARAWAVPGRVGDRVALQLVSGLEAVEA